MFTLIQDHSPEIEENQIKKTVFGGVCFVIVVVYNRSVERRVFQFAMLPCFSVQLNLTCLL